MLLVSWRHFGVGFLTVNFVLRSDTFFPSKVCNKYTYIYGGTKEFRKISTFSKLQNFENFTPFFGPWGSCPPIFETPQFLPRLHPSFHLKRHPYATLKKYQRKSRKPKTFYG